MITSRLMEGNKVPNWQASKTFTREVAFEITRITSIATHTRRLRFYNMEIDLQNLSVLNSRGNGISELMFAYHKPPIVTKGQSMKFKISFLSHQNIDNHIGACTCEDCQDRIPAQLSWHAFSALDNSLVMIPCFISCWCYLL